MHCNIAGLSIIKECEGLSLKSYLCPANVLTIGYGHTGKDVVPNLTIGEEKAEDLLHCDLRASETAIEKAVTVPLTENQFSALCSLVFNIGVGNFKNSTLLKMLNAGNYAAAADEFLRWDKSNGKPLAGLTKRRRQEQALFNT